MVLNICKYLVFCTSKNANGPSAARKIPRNIRYAPMRDTPTFSQHISVSGSVKLLELLNVQATSIRDLDTAAAYMERSPYRYTTRHRKNNERPVLVKNSDAI
jgi:hypothetical protein